VVLVKEQAEELVLQELQTEVTEAVVVLITLNLAAQVDQVLLSYVTLDLSEVLEEQLRPLADTQFTHLHLREHTQHEPFCTS
jgi:hypothetical protein